MNNKAPIAIEKMDKIKAMIREEIGDNHEFILVVFPANREDGVTNTLTTVENNESAYILFFAAKQLTKPERPTFIPPSDN